MLIHQHCPHLAEDRNTGTQHADLPLDTKYSIPTLSLWRAYTYGTRKKEPFKNFGLHGSQQGPVYNTALRCMTRAASLNDGVSMVLQGTWETAEQKKGNPAKPRRSCFPKELPPHQSVQESMFSGQSNVPAFRIWDASEYERLPPSLERHAPHATVPELHTVVAIPRRPSLAGSWRPLLHRPPLHHPHPTMHVPTPRAVCRPLPSPIPTRPRQAPTSQSKGRPRTCGPGLPNAKAQHPFGA